jgi:glycosyltransferase involved in cell wall biosynthesis
MRILVAVPLPLGPKGGVEDYALGVLRGLQTTHDVTVLAPTTPAEQETHVANLGPVHGQFIRARRLMHRRWPVASSRRNVENLVREADVVHVHMPSPRLERWVAEAATDGGVPVVATYHMDAIYDGGNLDAKPTVWGRFLQRMYDRTSAVPALNGATVVAVNSLGYAKESRLLPSYLPKVRRIIQGVDTDHTISPDRGLRVRNSLIQPGGRLITYLGRLVPYKGVSTLVEAAKSIDATFVIAGTGSLRAVLENQVKRAGLGNRVRFLGFVPDEDVGGLLHASDLVVAPSISLAESTPIVLLEALACGTPVVGTRLGGTEETIPNDGVHGRLVRPRDPKALADGLDEILTSSPWQPDRRSLYARSWADVAADYERLYRECAS